MKKSKWLKVAAAVSLSTSASAVSQPQNSSAPLIQNEFSIEATDLVAKKMKDRSIVGNEAGFEIEATDLVAKKMKDRNIVN